MHLRQHPAQRVKHQVRAADSQLEQQRDRMRLRPVLFEQMAPLQARVDVRLAGLLRWSPLCRPKTRGSFSALQLRGNERLLSNVGHISARLCANRHICAAHDALLADQRLLSVPQHGTQEANTQGRARGH